MMMCLIFHNPGISSKALEDIIEDVTVISNAIHLPTLHVTTETIQSNYYA